MIPCSFIFARYVVNVGPVQAYCSTVSEFLRKGHVLKVTVFPEILRWFVTTDMKPDLLLRGRSDYLEVCQRRIRLCLQKLHGLTRLHRLARACVCRVARSAVVRGSIRGWLRAECPMLCTYAPNALRCYRHLVLPAVLCQFSVLLVFLVDVCAPCFVALCFWRVLPGLVRDRPDFHWPEFLFLHYSIIHN